MTNAKPAVWTISRGPARGLKGWHIQARTSDQLCSFAQIVGDDAKYYRGTSGPYDVFTLTDPTTMCTMNICGTITYVQSWSDVDKTQVPRKDGE